MEWTPSVGFFRHTILLLCLFFSFGGVFYTYYKPTVNWWSCPNAPVFIPETYPNECRKVLGENLSETINTTTLNTTPAKQELATTQPAVTQENTIILIWKWPFDTEFDDKSCGPLFGIEGCQFTNDRSLYDKAHGVMFHHREIDDDFRSLLNRPRPPHQKWIWMNMESPDNSERLDEIDDVFNLTSSYRRDSDVWAPYGRIVMVSKKDKPFYLQPKDKLVCWIVSNWNQHYRRSEYFNELSKYIQIETYGKHFDHYIENKDFVPILIGCKFYLSFENSIHKDYFTEKVYKPLAFGTVPVVLGPPRENYEEFIPSDSFIHVDDFKSPRELAEHLKYLDRNQEMYEQYFRWRQHFIVQPSYFGVQHACYSCEHIRKYKGYRVFKNLNKWYWG